MRGWLAGVLRRWADAAVRAHAAELEAELARERARGRVLAAEVDGLAGVVARDRARVQSETAGYARKTAEAGV
jgi:hypothetical protein